MNSLIRACGLGILCTVISLTVKQYKPEFSLTVRAITVVIIFTSVITSAEPIISYVRAIGEAYGISKYVGYMVTAIGMTVITQISSDICRDCGENSVSSMIELAGKIELIILSVPIIKEILESISGVLSNI